MSAAAIVTGGYGTPGSAALVVTRGFSSGTVSVDVGIQYVLTHIAPDFYNMSIDGIDTSDDLAHLLEDTSMGFAEAFTVAGGATVYYGLFDDEAIDLGSRDKDPPILLCKATDAESWTHGQTVVIRTITYYIAGLQPDGLGLMRIVLEVPQ